MWWWSSLKTSTTCRFVSYPPPNHSQHHRYHIVGKNNKQKNVGITNPCEQLKYWSNGFFFLKEEESTRKWNKNCRHYCGLWFYICVCWPLSPWTFSPLDNHHLHGQLAFELNVYVCIISTRIKKMKSLDTCYLIIGSSHGNPRQQQRQQKRDFTLSLGSWSLCVCVF